MRKRTSFFIFLFLSSLILFSLFPGCSGCLPTTPVTVTGTINGYVAIPDGTAKDLTGYSPIPGATVTIVDAEGVTHTVITDEDGYYFFNNINIKINTIINITKDTEGGGKLIFKDIVPLAVSSEEDYDAGIADAASTVTALVVEELVNLGQVQEEIGLDEITSSEGFDELKEDIEQAQEDNQDINTNPIDTQAEEIADNIVNPPTPTPEPDPTPEPTSPSPAPAPTPTPLTAIGAITGTPKVGVTLTAGALTPSGATATYQWQICATAGGTYANISGATSTTYTPVADDATKFIKVAATGTGNYSGTVTSTATAAVAAATYTVTFDKNDAGATGSMADQTIPSGSSANLTACAFTKTGWTFADWATSSGGSVAYADEASYTMGTANVTLYAKWTINTYTVTFNKNGGDTEADPTTKTATHGGNVGTLPTAPTKTGYGFTGWNTQANGSGTEFTAATAVTADITVYAQWTINSYTLVMSKTGSGTGTTIPTLGNHIYDYGDEITISASPATSSTFNGWSGDATGTSNVTLTMNENKSVTATFTLKSYTITASAEANGAISPSGAVGVNHGADQAFTITADANYHIADVVVDGSSVGAVGTYTFTNVTADHTISATFAIDTYTVTYSGNGSTSGTVPTGPVDYDYEATVTVLDNTGNLVKTGWTFAGWNTQANGEGTDRAEGSTFTMGSSNVTLYAQWTPPDPYLIGDVGPAGGWIFYDDTAEGATDITGARYLEAAPSSTEWTGKKWGSYSDPLDTGKLIGGTAVGIGTGQSNTTIIVTWLNSNTDDTYGDVTDKALRAAYLCDALIVDEYDDWFLPSKDELNLMYTNLHCQTPPVGEFNIDNWYWSSSEDNNIYAWMQLFDGSSAWNCKYYPIYVRAIRAF
jgi:uncharacterized repeat protein (TIGR02543 family)